MKRKTQNTHFTIETRMIIEEMLDNNYSITEISKNLYRDRSNIGREIEKHKIVKFPSSFNKSNPCINKNTCSKRAYDCFKTCTNFIEQTPCEKLSSTPHVCNGCNKRQQCRHVKYYYNAKEANEQYLEKLSLSRTNLHYTPLELNVLNNDFYNLVIHNKSLYHSLVVINKYGFNFNLKTIYRQIKLGLLRLKPSDLPRATSKAKRKEIDKTYKRDVTGHTYENYLNFIKKNPSAIEWQMDCVQGIQGADEPVFLTLQIVKIKFLFIFIIKRQTADEVVKR